MPGVIGSSGPTNAQITAMAWDQFAAQALGAMIAKTGLRPTSKDGQAALAKNAAELADALMKERADRSD